MGETIMNIKEASKHVQECKSEVYTTADKITAYEQKFEVQLPDEIKWFTMNIGELERFNKYDEDNSPKHLSLVLGSMKYIIILIAIFTSIDLYSQESKCGYKYECVCDTLNESVNSSYEFSDIVIEGVVLMVDTISVAKIIYADSANKIINDTLINSVCAKKVLETEKVLLVKIQVQKTFKGEIDSTEVFILSPLKESSCSYSDFQVNTKFVVYATNNLTADIYFLWTLDKDYFYLKPEYRFWTNKCKRTRISNAGEINELKKITELNKPN